jgi:protein O-mannosyl-transferase
VRVTQNKKSRLALLAALLLATLAVYARTMDYGLVNWDDPLAGVQLYQETPELPGLAEMLKPRASATYQPVRALATALLAPFGARGNWMPYHVVSLLFYLGTVLMLYLVALRLFIVGRICRQPSEAGAWAMLAAALFALHPSHAEVVAWVTGHKDTFVGFFYLGAIYFYIRRTRLSVTDTALCMIFYFLALGSKPSAVSLPLVLVAYDFLIRDSGDGRRWYAGRVIAYLLFFAPACAAVVFFAGTTTRVGDLVFAVGELPGKMVKLTAAYGFSAIKLLLPVNLCLRYPSFNTASVNPSLYLHVISGAAIIGWTVRSVWRRAPYAFVLVWFTLTLLPNANLIRIQIERADRYYYLSSAAFAVIAAIGALWLYRSLSERQRPLLRRLAVCSLLLLAVVSWKQAGYWNDPLSAWKRVYRLYPNLTLARLGLASGYLRSGEWDEALRLYKPLLEGGKPNTRAIKGAMYISEQRGDMPQVVELARLGRMFAPGDDDFLSSLARYYFREQDTTAVREVVCDWVDRRPKDPLARLNQAALYLMEGNDPQAESVYLDLIGSHDYLPEPYAFLAEMKMEAGDFQQAEKLLHRAIATGLRTADSRQQLAALHERTGKARQAHEIYSRYDIGQLKMSGLEFMGAHHFGLGELEQSLGYFQQMTARDSSLPRAWSNTAVVLQELGRAEVADSFYRRAIGLDSSYVDAYFNRGNLLAELGRDAEAVWHYNRADSLVGGTDQAVLRSLADALSASGDTAEAIRVVERLRVLNTGGGPK